MTIKDMHYDFKQKLNEIDSQRWRGLEVPEIDWKLNEAIELFVKLVAQPRLRAEMGFEIGRRTIDDIRTIVVDQKPIDYLIPVIYDTSSFIVELPLDYWFLSKLKIIASKSVCTGVLLYRSKEVQHDDEHEVSPFDRSNFEWRTSNYRFNKEGIRMFTDGSFVIDKVGFEYLIKPILVHDAEDWKGGSYDTLDGVTLTGTQDCDLPDKVHREIVDLAVFITAGDLNLPSYQSKQNKVSLSIMKG